MTNLQERGPNFGKEWHNRARLISRIRMKCKEQTERMSKKREISPPMGKTGSTSAALMRLVKKCSKCASRGSRSAWAGGV